MKFHGLFIGVDRYASPAVSWLTCAVRDAEALYALFVDTFGSSSASLLTDENATRAALIEDIERRLATTNEEDFVVITFSGHGSDDHFLVTHDADPDHLESTSIHVDELVGLFAKIPAHRVLLVLDCCFSGGAGARVFRHGPTVRSLKSIDEALEAIAHEGRVILTACDPNQEAIEDDFVGHGLLTWFLMEGLKGAPDVVRDGRVPLLALADFVTHRVHDEAASFGHDQRPTFRGTIDGAFALPPLVAGAETARRFPERAAPPVSEDVGDLAAHGIPPFVIEAWRGAIPGLNELQRRAVNEFGVLVGKSLVVSAPTSSGKTMIGELAALRAFADRKRALFLLPLKALVGDKFSEFSEKYGALGVRIIRATGEMHDDIPDLLAGRFDICLMTYEKASSLLLAFPHVLRGTGVVVVDEVQMLANTTRGANLEYLLTLLKYRRRDGLRPQMVLLSAVIGDTNGLERWASASLLRTEERPVPLLEGVLRSDGSFRYLASDGTERVEAFIAPEYRKGKAQDVLIPLARKLCAADERLIVFREKKPETRSVAKYLARELGLPRASSALEALPPNDLSAGSLTLRECLEHGVAFHNADLAREERRIVEQAFRERDGVHVLVATTTIAMGVNTPASTVAIVGLQHPGGDPYSVAEYKNMVGRAGRLGFSEVGKSMVVCLTPADEYRVWNNYVMGKPEPLTSRFLASDPMLLVTRVLATAERSKLPGMTEEQVVGFVQSSFGAFQQAQRAGPRAITGDTLRGAFTDLLRSDLIRKESDGYRLTELGRLAGEGGVAIRSIIGLASVLRGTPLSALNEAAILAATQVTEELDQIVFPVHATSHQERSRWQTSLRTSGLPYSMLVAVLQGPQATSRAKRVAALLMWLNGTEMREIEKALLTHMPGDDAAGAIRSVADRTRDLLPTALRVAEILTGTAQDALSEMVERLLVRLELGVPDTIVDLAEQLGARLTRGDYLALNAHAVHSLDAISRLSDEAVERVVGSTRTVALLRGFAPRFEPEGSSAAS